MTVMELQRIARVGDLLASEPIGNSDQRILQEKPKMRGFLTVLCRRARRKSLLGPLGSSNAILARIARAKGIRSPAIYC